MNRTRNLLSAGIGATAAYLFDPDMGRTRRARIADQAGAVTRRTRARIEKKARYKAGVARGAVHRFIEPLRPPAYVDDATLLQKVRSEALGPWDGPASVEVAIESGIIFLHGSAPRDSVSDLIGSIEGVQGVSAVVDETVPVSEL